MADSDGSTSREHSTTEKLTDVAKLNFRSWLWAQHREKTKFAPLARLVLGGGPENMWANKPLKAGAVEFDIAQMFATGRGGITQEIFELSKEAVEAYREDDRSVGDMIREQEQVFARAGMALSKEMTRRVVDDMSRHGLTVPDDRPTRWTEGGLVQVQCEYLKRTGTRCARWSLPGQTLCDLHGGLYLSPEEVKQVLSAGQERLIAASGEAIDTVLDIMQNSVRDEVRLKAAEMLLDRAGFKPGMETAGRDDGKADKTPMDKLHERLDRLAPQVVDQDGRAIEAP